MLYLVKLNFLSKGGILTTKKNLESLKLSNNNLNYKTSSHFFSSIK